MKWIQQHNTCDTPKRSKYGAKNFRISEMAPGLQEACFLKNSKMVF
jgi:hypothetical protein